MKKLTLALIVTTLVGLFAVSSPLFADDNIVTSFDALSDTPTPGVWYEYDVRTGGTASITDLTGVGGHLEYDQPLPAGAAMLTTDITNDAKAEVGVYDDYGKPNEIFSTLSISYSFYKASNANQNYSAAPSIKLTFLNPSCVDSPDEECFGTLVYEPYWNVILGAPFPIALQPTMDEWTIVTIDEDNGYFWWTGGFGEPNSYGGRPLFTLKEWLRIFPDDFGEADLVLVSIGVGTYNQGQIGYFDDVVISHLSNGGFYESYDFEPAPQFEIPGECISTYIADNCSGLNGRSRATCNHEQQMICFDLFGIK